MSSSLLNCSFCLYAEVPPSSPKDMANTQKVTVINGHATCAFHAEFAGPAPWAECYNRFAATFGFNQREVS